MGTPDSTVAGHDDHEEDHQVELAQRLQQRRREPEGADQRGHAEQRDGGLPEGAHAQQAQQRHDHHERHAAGMAAARQALLISSAGVTMKRLFVRVVDRRPDDQHQEGDRRGDGEGVEQARVCG
jgi:hypothetical protein